jgi:hypothetical protein
MPKAIVEKVLRSGLVDKATAELMEQWGYLEPGSAEKVNENALKDATRETLSKLANDLAVEVDKEHVLRETHLDLERIRWPADIAGIYQPAVGQPIAVVKNLSAVVDRMGRYYFRFDDVKEEWFVPGFIIERKIGDDFIRRETVTEKQVLFIDETPICVQVSTMREVV